MKQIIGSYRYGSTVNGTATENSDLDGGYVVYSGLRSFIDISGHSKIKNSFNSGENDIEYIELISFFRQVLQTQPVLVSKIWTLESQVIPVFYIRNLLNENISWKPYLYRCISFAKNRKPDIKGIKHGLYMLAMFQFQYKCDRFCVNPKFWKAENILGFQDFINDYRSDKQNLSYWQSQLEHHIKDAEILAETLEHKDSSSFQDKLRLLFWDICVKLESDKTLFEKR